MTPLLQHDRVAEVETFSKPGTADVTAGDRKKLSGILKHYRAEAHPFTACKKDQMKHGLSEEHANRRCAVIKDIIEGTTKWRKGSKASEAAIDIVAEALAVVQLAGVAIGGRGASLLMREAVLTSKERNKLPASAFVFPKERRYPIHDEAHARNALSRAAGKPEEATVRAAVKKRYPNLGKSQESLAEAAEQGHWIEELQLAAAVVEAAPTWMIPIAARRPGFKPLKPEKKTKSSSSSSSEFNRLHPRGSGAQGGQFVRKGSSGTEVTAVQRRLGISETGTYGGRTKRRVEAFQKNHGLQVDGIVGAQTVAALRGQAGAKKVAPGALTKNDRRYLRRYSRRTTASGGTTSTPRTSSSGGGGSSGPKSTVIKPAAGVSSRRIVRTRRRTSGGYGRGGVIV